MIKIKVIFGSDAVKEYKNTGIIPDAQWFESNGGGVNEKNFRTQEEYDAYIEGVNDVYGWPDYHFFDQEILPDETVPEPQKELRVFQFPADIPRDTPDEEILRLWNDPDDDSVKVCTLDELAAELNDNNAGFSKHYIRFIMI